MGLRGREYDQPIRTAREMGNGDSTDPRDYDLDDLDNSQAVSQAPGNRNANGANGGYMKTNQALPLPHDEEEVYASELFGGPYEKAVKEDNDNALQTNALNKKTRASEPEEERELIVEDKI